jgi:hypothetical protein
MTLTLEDALKPYAEELGNLVIDWNTMQEGFCMLFCVLLEVENFDKALAIWHLLKSDKLQRDLVDAVAPHCSLIRKDPKAIELIKWAVKHAMELGTHRDDAVHSPYVVLMEEPISLGSLSHFNHPRALGLKEAELIGEFARIKGNIKAITLFVYKLQQYIIDLKHQNEHPTLPERPSLQKRKT